MIKNKKVINAVYIGLLCSISYLAVYFARNILGTVSPKMIDGGFSEEYIGRLSSVYFICYACGQLINGKTGDRIKARYMISGGLFFAGITNLLFSYIAPSNPDAAIWVYGITGVCLSMIYGPMTKTIAENTEPVYATRCSLGYTFSSFFGSPMAGVAATVLPWQKVFSLGCVCLVSMAVIAFMAYLIFEKNGVIKYGNYKAEKESGGGIRVLIKHRIIKFTLISIITGVIRTSVVFWLPTYTSQYLGFTAEKSALIFTVATFVISFTTFISVGLYEVLKRNMDLNILIMFSSATVFFAIVYFVSNPVVNIVCLVLAIMASNGAATMLWTRYCPGLRDTGMVSSATGFLDFVSYMAAAASSTLFANAVGIIGWGNLILVWCGLMGLGVIVSLPYKIWWGEIK